MNIQFFKLRRAFEQEFIDTRPVDYLDLALRHLEAAFNLGETSGGANANRPASTRNVERTRGHDKVEVTFHSTDAPSSEL